MIVWTCNDFDIVNLKIDFNSRFCKVKAVSQDTDIQYAVMALLITVDMSVTCTMFTIRK